MRSLKNGRKKLDSEDFLLVIKLKVRVTNRNEQERKTHLPYYAIHKKKT